MWNISDFEKAEIRREFEQYFTRLYEGLGAANTADTVASVVSTHRIQRHMSDFSEKSDM